MNAQGQVVGLLHQLPAPAPGSCPPGGAAREAPPPPCYSADEVGALQRFTIRFLLFDYTSAVNMQNGDIFHMFNNLCTHAPRK